MNKQIKKLAEQAGGSILINNGLDFAVVFGELDDFKKFAELIVRECAKACEKNSYLALNGQQRAKQIKEHFGIEE